MAVCALTEGIRGRVDDSRIESKQGVVQCEIGYLAQLA
jgi:hypothetical protein